MFCSISPYLMMGPEEIVLELIDHFDRLPDSILLLVFNKIGDVKALGRCCVVSKRFHYLVPQVENITVRVDCVISDNESSSMTCSLSSMASVLALDSNKSRSLLQFLFTTMVKPLQSLVNQFMTNSPHKKGMASLSADGDGGAGDEDFDQNSITRHSPTQVLKNFDEVKFLRIELPAGELGVDQGVLQWRANFGSTLDNCVILGATSVSKGEDFISCNESFGNDNGNGDNGSIPKSFYTNGGLKLRVVWIISSLITASNRHYLLQPIIVEHKTLNNLVLTEADGQGVLYMNKEQLEELRVKPLTASSASKRTLVPALNMRLWYAPHLDLPDGTVLKGATMIAIRPSEQPKKEVTGADGNWLASAFEEPYGTAAKMLVKRRTYCLEMNSF